MITLGVDAHKEIHVAVAVDEQDSLGRSAGTVASEERVARGERLSTVTYDELIRDRLAYGSPDDVVKLLKEITGEMGLSGIVAETNVGGLIPREKVAESINLFCKEVVPALR